MTKKRNKKYNPLKHVTTKLHPFAFTPITSPLDELKDLLVRGYLTSKPVRLLSDRLPTEYHLLVMLHQHTYIISELEKNRNQPIVRYIKQIRSVIEAYFKKVFSLSEHTETDIIVPDSVSIGTIGAAKLIWFIVNSKKSLFSSTLDAYKAAVKNGVLNASIKRNLNNETPISYFIDGVISKELMSML